MAKTRAIDMIRRTNWAMTEDALRQMMSIAMRQNNVAEWEAVRARKLEPLAGTNTVDIANGVGVLPIEGPIFRHANLFTDFSGATSIDMLAREFNFLVANPDVKSILLEIDSPGGEAAGVNELADMMFAARGKKPIWAYVSDLGCSAAYWIASTADKIYAAETSALGSIGVIATMHKPPGADSDVVEFISSQSPFKRPLYQEGGADRVQQMVDDLGAVFIEKVARNRGVETTDVLANFGNGWVLVGPKAVEAGLADGISTFESVLAEMQNLPTATSTDNVPPPSASEDASKAATEAAIEQPVQIEINPVNSESGSEPMDDVTVSEEATVSDQPIVEPSATPVAAAPTAPVQQADADRVRSLEAQLERMHVQRHTAEATAFADVNIAERKAFPAEREQMIAAFIQASSDDLKFGGTTSRVDLLKGIYSARPSHQLTMEALAPALAEIMNRGNGVSNMSQNDDRPLDAKQLEELLGTTPAGRAAVSAMKSGQ